MAGSTNSLEACALACYQKGAAAGTPYTFAGTEYGKQCFCGTSDKGVGKSCSVAVGSVAASLPRGAYSNGSQHTMPDPSNHSGVTSVGDCLPYKGTPKCTGCGMQCPGNHAQKCGGRFGMSQFSFKCFDLYRCDAATKTCVQDDTGSHQVGEYIVNSLFTHSGGVFGGERGGQISLLTPSTHTSTAIL